MNKKSSFLIAILAILIIGQFFYINSLNSKITNLAAQVNSLTRGDNYDNRLTKLEELVDDLDSDYTDRITELQNTIDDLNSIHNDRFDTLEQRVLWMEWDVDDIKNLLRL